MLKIGKLLLVWFPNPFAAGSQMGTLSSHCEKNGSLNRDLLNFLYRYGIFCLQVNPHIQAIQNMCGKGGWRVF